MNTRVNEPSNLRLAVLIDADNAPRDCLKGVMDEVATSVLTVWENSYVGKVGNSTNGRALFKTDVIAYIKELQRIEAVDTDYKPDENITIEKGARIDAVVGNIYKLPVLDAMEILYLDIEVKG